MRNVHGNSIRVAAVTLLLVAATAGRAAATHEPADKVTVAASATQVMETSGSSEVELLRTSLRTSAPVDLQLGFSAETGLYTEVSVTGTSESEARAKITVWVEVDGKVVPVTNDANGDGTFGDSDDGRMVLNNRDFKLASVNLPAVLSAFENTRSGNGFQWVALNVGNGIHDVVVKAKLEAASPATARASAAVGKRILVIEPTHMKNDATF